MKERLHTTDHILSSILENKFKAKIKGTSLKEESSKIEIDCETDIRPLKEELEKDVNLIIEEGHEVISYGVSREEAQRITDISFVPESINEINIYEIVGFNKVACAGLHVKNTREIGKFKIIKIEKRGKDRFTIKYCIE